jgi:hypothetical protein
MLINSEKFLDIAFELTLFILFIIICYYFLRTRILPSIYDQINSNRQYKKSLIEKSELLKDTLKSVDRDIEQESQLLASLESKVKIWHQKQIDENLKSEQEVEYLRNELEQKREIQQKNLVSSKIQKLVIPKAIEDAKLILEAEDSKREEAFKKLIRTFQK